MKPKKHLGQHFLADASVLSAMVEAIAPRSRMSSGDWAGTWCVDAGVVASGHRVVAVELIAIVVGAEVLPDPHQRLTVLHADALSVAMAPVVPEPSVVGNLPYQITSPLLFKRRGSTDH